MQRGPGRPFHRNRLRYDAGYRLELGYCFDRGIPWSVYLEEWSQEDRARVVAYAQEQASRCGLCGTSPWEWDPNQGGNKYAYEPALHVCFGCEKKDLLREDDDGHRAGASVILIPRAVAAGMRGKKGQ